MSGDRTASQLDTSRVRGESTVKSKDVNVEKPLDLDDVLTNELGQFGWFQIRNVILVSIPIVMSAFMSEFVFSAAAIPHRCQIPECGEEGRSHTFDPEWLINSIPETGTGFASCRRFNPLDEGTNGTLEYCPAKIFNQSSIIGCEDFVYARDNTVVYDFNLGCQDWLRALAGTLNSIGTLLVLPITGYLSDRFGRKIALIVSVFNMALIGLIRAFSVNYIMYLALQLLQTTLGAGVFSSSFIFAAELVGPKYRVLVSAITGTMFAVGQMVLGGVAWLISPWRYMIMALYIPCFLIISYYWFLTESVRWLLSKKKYTEAKEVLLEVAQLNKTQISEKSFQALINPPEPPVATSTKEGPGLVRSIIRSPVLLRRVCTTPIWWISTTLVYYGLSINSTGLSDTMHLNYILVSAVEIPGNFIAIFILDRIGRKATLSTSFLFSAACNFVFVFIPSDLTVLRLIVYLLGKLGITIVVVGVYLFTSELYPTEYRHSLLAFSSMIGRIGSITAPLTPVLMDYWHGIPSIMFAVMGTISGVLVLTQPETLGTSMPDTLAEAEALGKPK